MSDEQKTPTSESMASILQAFTQYLPDLIQVQGENILPYEQAKLDAQKAIAPQMAELQKELFDTYGEDFLSIGRELELGDRMAAAEADLEVLQGPGGKLADEALSIEQRLNPEFFETRRRISDNLGQLMSFLNPDNVGEEAARLDMMRRSSTGNVGNKNATNAIKSALTFGDERLKRANALTNVLQTGNQFMPASRVTFDPFGRPIANNLGANQIGTLGADPNVGQATLGLGSQLFGTAAGLQQQQVGIHDRRALTGLEKFGSVSNSLGSLSGFLF